MNIIEPKHSRYMDLMVDIGFKRVFSEKSLLIPLLSVVLPELEIKDLTYLDKESVGDWEGAKKTIFDLLVETESGKTVLVEVQMRPQEWFADRTLFYSSQQLLSQHPAGDIDYSLTPVYVVSFLNFEMPHDLDIDVPKDKIVWRYSLREDSCGERMTDALHFTFVEIGKFNKSESELASLEDRFYFCLKRMGTLESKPGTFSENCFVDLFKKAELSALSFKEQQAYLSKMTTERDYKNQMAYAIKKAVEEATEEVTEKVTAKTEHSTAKKIAKAMLNDNVPVETICKFTGLSKQTVNALK